MNKLTFYEQVGIVIPGSIVLFGALFYFPELKALLAKNGFSVGELGVFVLLAYAAGHLIAALGNAGEYFLWRMAGGMPSEWLTRDQTRLLSSQQRELLPQKIQSRLGIKINSVRGLDRNTWWTITRQIYADVAKNGKPERIDTFNGNYGLNRGLAAALIVLACVAATRAQWLAAMLLGVAGAIYAYRAYRFGIYYARELYVQFLIIEGKVVTTQRSKRGVVER